MGIAPPIGSSKIARRTIEGKCKEAAIFSRRGRVAIIVPMSETKTAGASSILLRRAELLGGLLDEDFEYFASLSGSVILHDGETLFSAGSKAERFWVVAVGALVVERDREVIARFGPGDVVGDFDFARGAPRDASAKSEGETSLVVFPQPGSSLADFATERPDASARLLLRSITMISSRIRSVQKLISENEPWLRELRHQSYTDSSTGLATRAFFEEEMARTLDAPCLFLMIKPDRFKDLVDARGHAAGDAAMSAIAALLRHTVRALGRGRAIRIKSNETALIVPRCDRMEAEDLARRLVSGFASLDLGPSCGGFRLSASMALGFWPEHGENPSRLFDAVYGLLQRSWRDGGRKVYAMRSRHGSPPEGMPERRKEQESPR